MGLCQRFFLPSLRPSSLPSFLPPFIPLFLPAIFLPFSTFLPPFLRSYLPSFLPPFLEGGVAAVLTVDLADAPLRASFTCSQGVPHLEWAFCVG